MKTIEIINNTRGGIAIENIRQKRERANGGQIQVPDVKLRRLTTLFSRAIDDVAIVSYIRDLNLPSTSALPNFALDAPSSVIYNLYGRESDTRFELTIPEVKGDCSDDCTTEAPVPLIWIYRKRMRESFTSPLLFILT